MKKIIFFLFVFCSIEYSVSQSLTPETTSPAGNHFINGSSQLDWTVGEPATFTLNNGISLLTQGFHQNNLNITAVDNFDADYGLTVFPNPTLDIIQLQSRILRDEDMVIELYTAEGKLLLTQKSNLNALSQIDMSRYDSGTYLLKIVTKTQKGKSYQIVKLK